MLSAVSSAHLGLGAATLLAAIAMELGNGRSGRFASDFRMGGGVGRRGDDDQSAVRYRAGAPAAAEPLLSEQPPVSEPAVSANRKSSRRARVPPGIRGISGRGTRAE